MNPYKAKKIARIIAIIIVATMVITSVTALLAINFVSYSADVDSKIEAYLDTQLAPLKDFIKLIQERYKDEVDYKLLVDGAYAGVVAILGDPYSEYFLDVEDAEAFISLANSAYEGIGVSLEKVGDTARILTVIPDSPADKAGIIPGDMILKVDDTAIQDKSQNEIISLIRGESGAAVNLLLSRNGSTISYTLIRELFHSKTVSYEILEANIGYIHIDSFGEDTDKEFTDARTELVKNGAKSLIVDIRDNPGGVLETAVNITEQLMAPGVIAYLTHKGRLQESIRAEGTGYAQMPLVLLINEGSASASEIMAAALQDSNSAELVGITSYGKGVSQMILYQGADRIVKLSNFYFLRPSKEPIDKVGVEPDYVVNMSATTNSEDLLIEYESFAPMPERVKPMSDDMGLNVYGAQQRLKMLGYSVNTSGVMDASTVNAISAFQKNTNLYSYGVLDFTTMNKLDLECLEFVKHAGSKEDPQLSKAISLLTQRVN